jgi:hypothetical protein
MNRIVCTKEEEPKILAEVDYSKPIVWGVNPSGSGVKVQINSSEITLYTLLQQRFYHWDHIKQCWLKPEKSLSVTSFEN